MAAIGTIRRAKLHFKSVIGGFLCAKLTDMMTNEYEALASELLRALRGKTSQRAFSRQLGYRSNVAYTWESGRRYPTAAEALRIAEHVGVDLQSSLLRFFRFEWRWSTRGRQASPELIAYFLDVVRGGATFIELSRRAGLSRFAVARVISGDAQPRLPDFLRLIEAASSRVLDFVGVLVEVDTLPSFRDAWRRLEAVRYLALEVPFAEVVARALELDDYVALPCHREEWIAERLGISAEDGRRALDALAAAGAIRWEHPRWRVVHDSGVDTTRRYPEAAKALKRRWAQVASEHAERQAGDRFGYVVFTATNAELAQLESLLLESYHRIRDQADHMTGAERVALCTIQLAMLDHPDGQAVAKTAGGAG